MNALYITCFADPWIKVAQALREKHGLQPVFWIGYEDDDSVTQVPESFPDCIYQDYYDAWKGIFPAQIAAHANESGISIDFVKRYASFELQAIKMMDRMDPDQYSFNFMERQRHYRNMVRLCSACLESMKVDIVICDWIPHRLFDYVFYLLCQFHNIKFVFLGNTQFPGRVLSLNDLSAISDRIREDYNDILRAGMDAGAIKAKLPDDMTVSYDRVQRNTTGVTTNNVQLHMKKNRGSSGFFPLALKFIKDASHDYRSRYFGSEGYLLNGIPTYLKQRNNSIEMSRYGIMRYSLLKLKTNRYKNRLSKYYKALTVEPDFGAKYVFYALHYQPEMTTSPSGDIFVDQRLCIEVLHRHLPPDCLIYVKEHPVMFHSHMEGHTSRAKYFYDDLLSLPRVRLLPSDANSAALIKNSLAVATIRGTIGWEAMALGKPVIAFGLIWYEKYDGVLKVTNEESAAKMKDFIAGFKFDENKLFAYLYALSINSSLAYPYRGLKEKMNVSEADCVERLVNLVQGMIDPGHSR
ncbi:MAG: hypothetical protein JW925_10945 [Syntrophaceae bacterium]|nr:hypothetical protein [Syntrophaceae bacterium]